MRPLRNYIFVKLEPSLPTQGGIYLPHKADKMWLDAKIQLGIKATILQVGPGKRTPKKGTLVPMQSKTGDAVRLSELMYPSFTYQGEKVWIANEMDIVGVLK